MFGDGIILSSPFSPSSDKDRDPSNERLTLLIVEYSGILNYLLGHLSLSQKKYGKVRKHYIIWIAWVLLVRYGILEEGDFQTLDDSSDLQELPWNKCSLHNEDVNKWIPQEFNNLKQKTFHILKLKSFLTLFYKMSFKNTNFRFARMINNRGEKSICLISKTADLSIQQLSRQTIMVRISHEMFDMFRELVGANMSFKHKGKVYIILGPLNFAIHMSSNILAALNYTEVRSNKRDSQFIYHRISRNIHRFREARFNGDKSNPMSYPSDFFWECDEDHTIMDCIREKPTSSEEYDPSDDEESCVDDYYNSTYHDIIAYKVGYFTYQIRSTYRGCIFKDLSKKTYQVNDIIEFSYTVNPVDLSGEKEFIVDDDDDEEGQDDRDLKDESSILKRPRTESNEDNSSTNN